MPAVATAAAEAAHGAARTRTLRRPRRLICGTTAAKRPCRAPGVTSLAVLLRLIRPQPKLAALCASHGPTWRSRANVQRARTEAAPHRRRASYCDHKDSFDDSEVHDTKKLLSVDETTDQKIKIPYKRDQNFIRFLQPACAPARTGRDQQVPRRHRNAPKMHARSRPPFISALRRLHDANAPPLCRHWRLQLGRWLRVSRPRGVNHWRSVSANHKGRSLPQPIVPDDAH